MNSTASGTTPYRPTNNLLEALIYPQALSPADPAGSAEQRDGKGCGQDGPGNTVQAFVLRAHLPDWCLTRKRTPMMASDEARINRSDIRAQLTGSFLQC